MEFKPVSTELKNLRLQQQSIPSFGEELYSINDTYGITTSMQSFPIAFSPNGSILASINDNLSISLWNISSNTKIKDIGFHTAPFDFIVFSPDGSLIASGGESPDYSIKLWNVSSGNLVTTLTGHSKPVKSVDFSPNGLLLASGGRDNTLKLWNIMTGEVKTISDEEGNWINSIAFSPTEPILAAANSNSDITVWEFTSGTLPLNGTKIATLSNHTQAVYSLDFSPNGQALVSGSKDKTIRLWDISLLKESRTYTQEIMYTSSEIKSVAMSVDGTTFASSFEDPLEGQSIVKLWNRTFSPFQPINANLSSHLNQIRSIIFSPDASILASSSWDRSIKIWNVIQISNDLDNDGMDDNWESLHGLNSTDYWDKFTDLDQDGLTNRMEFYYNLNVSNRDSDGDSLPDGWEFLYTLNNSKNDANSDFDEDGLTNFQEYENGTNPVNPFDVFLDHDGDNMSTGWEAYYGLDPFNPQDAQIDHDLDGIPNLWEAYYGLNPINSEDALLDKDNDGMDNLWEHQMGLNLLDSNDRNDDPDNDLLSNIVEYGFNSSPILVDTDSDGMDDFYEYSKGFNPRNPIDIYDDFDGDQMLNGWEASFGLDPLNANDAQEDKDEDGIPNLDEFLYGLNPIDPKDGVMDHDDDGMTNIWEHLMGLDPRNNSDAILDKDGDNLTNLEEFGFNSSAILFDSDLDGMDDYYEFQMRLNPNEDDSTSDKDNDSLPNIWEYRNSLNANFYNDSRIDSDGDGIINVDEFIAKTDPNDFWSFPLISFSRIHLLVMIFLIVTGVAFFSFYMFFQTQRLILIEKSMAPDYPTAQLIRSSGYKTYPELLQSKNEAKEKLRKGQIQHNQGKFLQAIQSYEQGLAEFERIKNDRFIAESVYLIACSQKEISLLAKESSFLKRFPTTIPIESKIHGFDLMNKALVAEQSRNWGVARNYWIAAQNTFELDLEYHTQCQGAVLELDFHSILTNSEDVDENQFLQNLSKWIHHCKEKNLPTQLAQGYLLHARHTFSKYEIDEVEQWYDRCILVSRENGLVKYLNLAQNGKENLEKYRKRISDLLQEKQSLSPEQQHDLFREYMQKALETMENDQMD